MCTNRLAIAYNKLQYVISEHWPVWHWVLCCIWTHLQGSSCQCAPACSSSRNMETFCTTLWCTSLPLGVWDHALGQPDQLQRRGCRVEAETAHKINVKGPGLDLMSTGGIQTWAHSCRTPGGRRRCVSWEARSNVIWYVIIWHNAL